MALVPKRFGFIRTTLALWGADLFGNRAGVVTDAPRDAGTLETWGWYDGSTWRYAARRGGDETFGNISVTGLTVSDGNLEVTGGKTTLAPAAAGYASLNIPTRSAAVTAPVIGDMQSDGYGVSVHGLGLVATRGASDTSFIGSFFGLYDSATATKGWIFQLGASNTLDLWNYATSTWTKRIQFSSAGGIGFFGTAAPTSKPTVTGSRGGNAALASLLTQLAACGLLTDSTTA